MGFLDDIGKFFGSVVDHIETDTKWGVENVEGFAQKTESSFTGLISTPLILIAAGIGFMLYNSNVGQVAEATKNIGQTAAPLMV